MSRGRGGAEGRVRGSEGLGRRPGKKWNFELITNLELQIKINRTLARNRQYTMTIQIEIQTFAI